MRLCHNSSSRPSPAERDASRDPESFDFPRFSWIPGLTHPRIEYGAGLRGSPGMTVLANCDTGSMGSDQLLRDVKEDS
jgi:hypothetical protein